MHIGLPKNVSPQTIRSWVLVLVLVGTIVFFGTQIEYYFNARLFNRVSTSVAIIALLAVGQALVVLTRNIDLSVGSITGLTAYTTGLLLEQMPDLNPILTIASAVFVGGMLGVFNGLFVAYARIPAIIVTLGTLALFRTLLVEISGAQSITTDSLPEWILELPRTDVFSIGGLDLRVSVLITILVVIAFHIYVVYFRSGRYFYAVGSHPEAAEIAGLNSKRTVFTAFVLCGMLAGLAGFMFLSRFGNITVVAALGFELKSVAAVVVGGVNIFGGSGTIPGVFIGAVLVDLIDISLNRWELISEFWRDAVLGMLILLAVVFDRLLTLRLTKRQKK